jgi:hypothetical protein
MMHEQWLSRKHFDDFHAHFRPPELIAFIARADELLAEPLTVAVGYRRSRDYANARRRSSNPGPRPNRHPDGGTTRRCAFEPKVVGSVKNPRVCVSSGKAHSEVEIPLRRVHPWQPVERLALVVALAGTTKLTSAKQELSIEYHSCMRACMSRFE